MDDLDRINRQAQIRGNRLTRNTTKNIALKSYTFTLRHRSMDMRLIRTPHYYGEFAYCPCGKKALTFFLIQPA